MSVPKTSLGRQDAGAVEPKLHRVAVTTISVGELPEVTDLATLTTNGWHAGPLPLELRLPTGETLGGTTEARATYLDDHVAGPVLGTEALTWRAWTWLEPTVATAHGAVVWAAEVLRLPHFDASVRPLSEDAAHRPSADFAVVLHASVRPHALGVCEVLLAARDVTPDRMSTSPIIKSMRVVNARERPDVFRSIMVTTADGWLAPLAADGGAIDHLRHWLFSFASATLPRRVAAGRIPDFEADDDVFEAELSPTAVVSPSADWRIGVLRAGAAFVGCRADRGSTTSGRWHKDEPRLSDGEFFDAAEFYVHTVFTDAFLLGTLQRHAIRELRAILRQASAGPDDFERAREVARALTTFGERFWWTDAAKGGIADRLLRAYQHQHSLPAVFDQATSDAESIFKRAQLLAEHRKSGALAVLALLAVFSLVTVLARPFIPDPAEPLEKVFATGAILAIGGLVVCGLLTWMPELRRTIRDSRYGGGRQSSSAG